MDAHDIFKKLTKGIKFCRANNPTLKKKVENKKPLVEVKGEVKEEPLEEPCDLSDNEFPQGIPNISNNEITILSTLNTDNGRRGKKRKHETEEDLAKKRVLLETERINHYRNINHIRVVGKNVPEPSYTFDDFQIDIDIRENLKHCGYLEPTIIQRQVVPVMLKGQQLLACAPTGSGKTAAFLVPIIQQLNGPKKQGFRAIILCPTRELAKQTQRECVRLSEGRNFSIHIISKIKRALEQYGPKSNHKFDILVTTPKRVCFLLKQEPAAISLNNVEWLIVDEADKLFEDGNQGFRDQLNEIMTSCTNKNRRIAMFSATCTPVVSKWCVRNMKPLVRVTVGHRNAATLTVDQKLFFVGNETGKLLAFRDIVRKGISPPVLIFVQSKERAQQLFNELIYDGLHVDAIHGDRTQDQRDNTVKAFREGKIWVLICTELMARGIDFKGVNLVINYDFPPSAISYVHRIGRAGRAGRKGNAVTFFTIEDFPNLRSIANILKESGCEVPPYMLSIKKDRKNRKNKGKNRREDIRKKNIEPSKKGKVVGEVGPVLKSTSSGKLENGSEAITDNKHKSVRPNKLGKKRNKNK